MKDETLEFYHDKMSIRTLILEAISSHNEEVVVSLMAKLLEEYIELARLSSDNAYRKTWTHKDVLNYITYGELPK